MRATYLIALGALAASTSAYMLEIDRGPPQITDNRYREKQDELYKKARTAELVKNGLDYVAHYLGDNGHDKYWDSFMDEAGEDIDLIIELVDEAYALT